MHEDISHVAAYRQYAIIHFSTRKLFPNKLLKPIVFTSVSYTVTYKRGNGVVVKQL